MNICPICKKQYDAAPALSRTDGKTEICPICATREALDAAGITEGSALWEDVLQIVSRTYAEQSVKVPGR